MPNTVPGLLEQRSPQQVSHSCDRNAMGLPANTSSASNVWAWPQLPPKVPLP